MQGSLQTAKTCRTVYREQFSSASKISKTRPVSVKLNFRRFSLDSFEDIGLVQSRIQDFREGHANPTVGCTNLLFGQKVAKNCMKMKEIGLRGGHASLVTKCHALDPPKLFCGITDLPVLDFLMSVPVFKARVDSSLVHNGSRLLKFYILTLINDFNKIIDSFLEHLGSR